nr:NADH-quinone oxidoreductase subunit J [Micromonospora sp. Rc5]
MGETSGRGVPGEGLAKGLAVTLRTMTRRSTTQQYPDVAPELPPRSRGVIALLAENCTVCMLCARECPDWCIYIDSHKEEVAVPGAALIGGGAGLGLAALLVDAYRWTRVDLPTPGTAERLGEQVFRTWVLPFEVLSVLLLSALVGAVVLSRPDIGRRPADTTGRGAAGSAGAGQDRAGGRP